MKLQPDNALVIDGRTTTAEPLVARFERDCRDAGLDPNARIAVVASDPERLIGAAAGCFHSGRDAVLVDAETADDALRDRLASEGYAQLELAGAGGSTVVREPTVPVAPVAGRIAVWTSGSTGAPRLVEHRWSSLYTLERAEAGLAPRRWLQTYAPASYAWYQLVTAWLFAPGQDLVVSRARQPEDLWAAAASAGVDAVSATPTLWRHWLLTLPADALRSLPLRQITLGGEPVDQPILDRLAALFPEARISHVYASTEAGAAIVVHDGGEGFPAHWLDRPDERTVGIELRDGVLWLRSPFASSAVDGWYDTGDAAELRSGGAHGDRVVVVGRADGDVVNVGGRKVRASAVEHALRAHPSVLWCRVGGRRSPIAGAVVAAEIVLDPEVRDADPQDVERALVGHCRDAGLADWMTPRLFQFLGEIPMSASGKSPLRAAEPAGRE